MTDHTFSAARELQKRVAPETRHVPLYHVPAIGANAARAAAAGAIACQVRGRNLAIQQWLEDRGQWAGPGIVTMWINSTLPTEVLLGTTLHELAHALPLRIPSEQSEPPYGAFDFDMSLLSYRLAQPTRPPNLAPWFSHEADFIRNCLHLTHRAQELGYDIGWHDVGFAGSYYGLSPAWRYAEMLGDEPARFWNMGASFDVIAATDAPDEFTNLFNNDVRKWNASHSQT